MVTITLTAAVVKWLIVLYGVNVVLLVANLYLKFKK
jgi:hypothetical protein